MLLTVCYCFHTLTHCFLVAILHALIICKVERIFNNVSSFTIPRSAFLQNMSMPKDSLKSSILFILKTFVESLCEAFETCFLIMFVIQLSSTYLFLYLKVHQPFESKQVQL